jgi:hypothetical protein
MNQQLFAALLAGASLLTVSGCSDPNHGIVSGSVRVDGKPVDGSISFFPVDGKSSTTGAKIVEGEYTCKVPVGENKVEIRVSKKVGETKLYNTPDSPVQPILAEVLPPKYNDQSELRVDVQSGENTQDYDLSSSGK